MPYIPEEKRKKYDNVVKDLINCLYEEKEDDVGGCLNYVIYKTVKDYLKRKGERYYRYEKFIGTLNSCAMEIYRRLVATYEDKAIDKNGDV